MVEGLAGLVGIGKEKLQTPTRFRVLRFGCKVNDMAMAFPAQGLPQGSIP